MKNATKILTTTFGAIWALAGLEHGVGEVLQGNTAPEALMFPSWPNSAFFSSLGGEPAMSLIPNLLVSGILTILLSLMLLVWVFVFIQKKHGGLVMIAICISMLLVGGGIFPPVLGIVIGAVAVKMNAGPTKAQQPSRLSLFLSKIWPFSFSLCILAWLSLFPGLAALGYFFGVDDPVNILVLLLTAFALLILTIIAGFASDSQQRFIH